MILAVHIASGALALGAGAAALSFGKGSRRHRLMGNLFFASMLVMAASGTVAAWRIPVMLSVVGGLLTLYLVATAWATVRREPDRSGHFEIVACLAALVIGTASVAFGLQAQWSESGLKDGFSAGQYHFFGAVALVAAALDFRVILAGGLDGVARIARHLWRMCFALFIASSAFFLGQARLFPEALRESAVLWVLGFLPLFVMAFWLVRIRLGRSHPKL